MGNRASGGMSGLSKEVTFATINLQVVRGLAVDPLDKSQASDSPVTQPSILSPRSYIERLGKIHPLHGHSQAWKLSPRILLTVQGTSGGAGFDVTFSQLGLGYLDLLPSPCARSLGACILRSKSSIGPFLSFPVIAWLPRILTDERKSVSTQACRVRRTPQGPEGSELLVFLTLQLNASKLASRSLELFSLVTPLLSVMRRNIAPVATPAHPH